MGRNDEFENPIVDPKSGGDSRGVWVELCRRGLQTQTLFKTKIAHFDALFKTRDKRHYFLTLICFVLYTELGNFSH